MSGGHDMTCNFCGAGVSGSLREMIAWSDRHDKECPGPKRTTTEES